MEIKKQFSVFMVNKPGVLAQVLGRFADAKVNIIAMTMSDTVEHGVMRFVPVNPDKAADVLDRLNMPYNQTDVLSITLSNKPGALAEIAEKLARNHINIAYAYCTAGAKGGKTTGVLKVENIKKSLKVLSEKKTTKRETDTSVRRPPTARK